MIQRKSESELEFECMQQTLDRKETGHTNECYPENHPNFGVM